MALREESRLQALRSFEDEAFKQGYRFIAGIDEAGRGPLAGPVVAAACVLPHEFTLEGVNDSKQLTPKKREELFEKLNDIPHVYCGLGIVDHETIDRINIYQATIQAMLAAVNDLSVTPDILLVDGMKLPSEPIPYKKIIKGDELSISIASASIIAKVTRDRIMMEYHEMWPHYRFDKNKGYGTEEHLDALDKYGPCAIHRTSYEPVARYLQ